MTRLFWKTIDSQYNTYQTLIKPISYKSPDRQLQIDFKKIGTPGWHMTEKKVTPKYT